MSRLKCEVRKLSANIRTRCWWCGAVTIYNRTTHHGLGSWSKCGNSFRTSEAAFRDVEK